MLILQNTHVFTDAGNGAIDTTITPSLIKFLLNNHIMRKISLISLLSLTAAAALPLCAQNSNSSYSFKHPDMPKMVERYSQTAYTSSDHALRTLRGDLLGHEMKQTVTDISVDPAGRMVAAITLDKKGQYNLVVVSTQDRESNVFKYQVKKYGVPTAVCFGADARTMMVATDKGIHIFSLPKFELTSTMVAPQFPITDMAVSRNGQLMMAKGEDKVALYNMEQHSVRHTFDVGERVNAVSFSPDSEYLALLTADGLLEIYFTNSLRLRTSIEDLGEGLALDFNDNGKYVAVATSPTTIEVINLVKQEDRRSYNAADYSVSDLIFLNDANDNALLAFPGLLSMKAERVRNLEPYFSKLVSDEADRRMNEWLKMMPGESMEEYAARVNDEARKKQRRLFEDDAATSFAGDMLSMADITLGSYDRGSQRLEVGFSNMPTIYLPVPESNISAFRNGGDLTVEDARYGVMPDDSFELIYARFINNNDGQTYIYDNQDRVPMSFLEGDDNIVSLEVLQQQQMEEMKLQEIKEQIVTQAKHDNIISDHTHIAVDSQVVPAYDAAGKKILNYLVTVSYTVDPEFSTVEDFGPGKYRIEESGAAKAMTDIVKQAFMNDLSQYLTPGRKVKVKLSGSADSTPIVRGIPYDGAFGDFEDEPVWQNGTLAPLSVSKASGIKTNEQLAFLRATAVKDWLEKNVPGLRDTSNEYDIHVDVAEGKGAEFRRINAEFTFVDVFGE